MRERPPSSNPLHKKIDSKPTDQLAEQIAFQLATQRPALGRQWAWVIRQNKIYWTEDLPIPHRPSSAIVKLIQFLFEEHVDLSFFILRNRIYATAALTPMDRGMVRLAAKRVTDQVRPQDHAFSLEGYEWIRIPQHNDWFLQSTSLEKATLSTSVIKNKKEAISLLQELEQQVLRGPVLHDFNRPIAVIITDAEGNVLSSAVNSNAKNKTMHAEVVATQIFFHQYQKPFPKDTKIYVSLKPCLMCAGMIAQMSETPSSVQVYFCQDDPGTRAKNTVLDQWGCQHQLLHDTD